MKPWIRKRSLGAGNPIPADQAAEMCRSARRMLLVMPHQTISHLLAVTPLLRNLRQALPEAHITFVAGPRNAEAVLDNPDLNAVEVARMDGPLGWLHVSRLTRRLRGTPSDVAIVLPEVSPGALALARESMPRLVLGMDDGLDEPLRNSFDCLLEPPEETRTHIVDRHLALLEHLGIPITNREHVLGVTREQRVRGRQLLAEAGLDPARPIFGAHVGGIPHRPQNQWPPSSFAAVLQRAALDHGHQPLVLGTEDDLPTIEQVQALGKTPIPRLLDLPFADYKAVVSCLRFFVSHDGEPVHIAAGVGSPSFFIFLTTPPWQWAPYGSHVAVWEDFGQVPGSSEIWKRIEPRLEAPA